MLLAITSREPMADDIAIEIPDLEKQRTGLEADKRLWIVLHEYN